MEKKGRIRGPSFEKPVALLPGAPRLTTETLINLEERLFFRFVEEPAAIIRRVARGALVTLMEDRSPAAKLEPNNHTRCTPSLMALDN